MAHKYICQQCQQTKTCTIAGCDGTCVKTCVNCLRKKGGV